MWIRKTNVGNMLRDGSEPLRLLEAGYLVICKPIVPAKNNQVKNDSNTRIFQSTIKTLDHTLTKPHNMLAYQTSISQIR